MKACIGVNKISELWMYEEQEGVYSCHSGASSCEDYTPNSTKINVDTNTDEEDVIIGAPFYGGKRYD